MQDVKVTYDFEHRKIGVEVLVEDIDGTRHITAALPLLLSGEWTVTWTLKAGVGIVGQPIFESGDGINLIAKPTTLTALSQPALLNNGASVKISFRNDCEDANLAKYDIRGSADDNPFSRGDLNTKFHHDPAIAVVKEPIEG